jgi:hypothetical protein
MSPSETKEIMAGVVDRFIDDVRVIREKMTMNMRLNTTFKAVLTGIILFWLAIILVMLQGCATKHLEFSSVDDTGKPYTIRADVGYLFTDQVTNGFNASIPGGLGIRFDAQGSQAKTEFLTELLKAYNSLP